MAADEGVSAGDRLRDEVLETWSLTAPELRLLDAAAALLDEIGTLEDALADSDPVVEGSMGQPRPNPLFGELRAHRTTLLRTVAALALPDPQGGTIRSPGQLQSVEAAQARWRRERRAGGVA